MKFYIKEQLDDLKDAFDYTPEEMKVITEMVVNIGYAVLMDSDVRNELTEMNQNLKLISDE
jgi:hypothetical protein